MKQAESIISAAYASGNIGLPFNRHITIHWGCYGIADHEAGRATSAFLKCAQQFHRTNRQPSAHLYVRENDEGDGSKGPHTHFLFHVPPGFLPRFLRAQMRWLRSITGLSYRKKAINGRHIGRAVNAAQTTPNFYAANLDATLRYILKASEPAATATLGLTRAPEYGRVVGKRCGWSENIGEAARRRYGHPH